MPKAESEMSHKQFEQAEKMRHRTGVLPLRQFAKMAYGPNVFTGFWRLTETMTKVLFICHGNICRSPMAEFVFRDMAERRGAPILVGSAATSTEEIGNPVYPPVRRLLVAHGLDPSGKTARQLRRSEYSDWDYFVGMDSANIRSMHRILGSDPERKILRLLDLTPLKRDVEDPWYTRDFETCWDDIQLGCKALLDYISKA